MTYTDVNLDTGHNIKQTFNKLENIPIPSSYVYIIINMNTLSYLTIII